MNDEFGKTPQDVKIDKMEVDIKHLFFATNELIRTTVTYPEIDIRFNNIEIRLSKLDILENRIIKNNEKLSILVDSLNSLSSAFGSFTEVYMKTTLINMNEGEYNGQ